MKLKDNYKMRPVRGFYINILKNVYVQKEGSLIRKTEYVVEKLFNGDKS